MNNDDGQELQDEINRRRAHETERKNEKWQITYRDAANGAEFFRSIETTFTVNDAVKLFGNYSNVRGLWDMYNRDDAEFTTEFDAVGYYMRLDIPDRERLVNWYNKKMIELNVRAEKFVDDISAKK